MSRADVLKHCPKAFARKIEKTWRVYAPKGSGDECIGYGATRPAAWSDASRLLHFRLSARPVQGESGE